MDDVIDLVAAAGTLPPERRKLKDLILRLRDAHSIKTDLMLATDLVTSMRVIHAAASKSAPGDAAENSYLALLYTTIILYVAPRRPARDIADHLISYDTSTPNSAWLTKSCATYETKQSRITGPAGRIAAHLGRLRAYLF